MHVNGRGQTQSFLQQNLSRCVVMQVLPTYHMGDALVGVVNHHCELIGPQTIGTFENKIANVIRYVLLLVPHSPVVPFQSLGQMQVTDHSLHIHTPSTRRFAFQTVTTSAEVNRSAMSC